MAIGFLPFAVPAARIILGSPSRLAISIEETVLSKGMFCTSDQTVFWKSVPFGARGKSNFVLFPLKKSVNCLMQSSSKALTL